VKRLLKKIRDKLVKLTSSSVKKTNHPKNEPVKDKTWEKRKGELLSTVRNTEKRRESNPLKQTQRPTSKPGAPRTSPDKQRPASSKPQSNVPSKKQDSEKQQGTERPVRARQERPAQDRQPRQPQDRQPRQPQDRQPRQPQNRQPRQPQEGRPQRGERIPRQAPETPPAEKWDAASFKVEPEEGKKRFHDFDLPEEVMHAISELGFKYCTPIQAEILSKTLAGKDASGKAQTGTGKTAAFLITIYTNFLRKPGKERKPGSPRALIMAPTRELVMQIVYDAQVLSKHTGIKILAIVGGIDYQKQRNSLNSQVDIVVATPGRLIDFYNKRGISLRDIELLVIDEADRMMDMGFIPDMRKIIRATPHKDNRQTLLFSATLPPEVIRLASSWTKDSEVVDVEPNHIAGENVEQIVYIISGDQKYPLLYNTIVQKNLNRVIVFTNRRDEAKKLKILLYANGLNTDVLSGDVDQRKRMRTLSDFKEGKINVLVATDVAGRGIHIEGISHVINYNLPEDPEDYVHRIGRTGRAGAAGISISFACEDDSFQIPAIEKYLGHKLEFTRPDDKLLAPPPAAERAPEVEAEPAPKYNRDQGNNKSQGGNRRYGGNRSQGSNGRNQNRSGNYRPKKDNGPGDKPAS
jgi:ATP-dependent RNA helicase RhlB